MASIDLSCSWTSYEGPPLVDLHVSRLGGQFWAESWSFLPDEAERLAQLLDEAIDAVDGKAPGPVGQFTHLDAPPDQQATTWLTVSVSPAPYLEKGAPRVHLLFEDQMTAERPDAASIWFTKAATRRLADGLRQSVVQALGDESAREQVRERVIPVGHSFSDLMPGRRFDVMAVAIRVHEFDVQWSLMPPPSEDELARLLQGLTCSAADSSGNGYFGSGSGCYLSAETEGPVAHGRLFLRPGLQAGINGLKVSLRFASPDEALEKESIFEVDLSWS